MKQIAHTPIFDLMERQDDGTIGFNPVLVSSPDWVTVVVEKDNKYLLVRQLRYGLMKECEEFCCGMVEKNEHPCSAAIRELKEETGIELFNFEMKCLGSFAANPAFMSNRMHYFYVNLDNAKWTQGATHLDEHEKLSSIWKDKNEVKSDCLRNHESVFMPAAFFLMQQHGIA